MFYQTSSKCDDDDDDDIQLKEIAETATSIEQYYKKPMDIEFCFYDETLFILQARPITRLIPIPDGRK